MERTVKYIPALVWLIFITILSTGPGVPLPEVKLITTDKLAHAAAYAVLCWLTLGIWRKAGFAQILWTVLFCTGYGTLMEWVQGTFYPNRFFEYYDMLANTAGAILAGTVYFLVKK
ncbi:MAG: VanZ family protein [Bacteroidota bacterium]|jgi:VanZ family protein|nr:VanZ family protein [Saprospiraceae bacterium]